MKKIDKVAKIVLTQVCDVKPNERVLIITNNKKEVEKISKTFYEQTLSLGAFPSLIVQEVKTLLDYADKSVVSALEAKPDVVLSISHNKLGKDEKASITPYKDADGNSYTSIFNYLREGTKELRAIWTPGLTVDMFCRTADINYSLLQTRCKKLISLYKNAKSVTVTSPSGTNILVPVQGRLPMADDGDFTKKGAGGNIPAGEVYISPVVGGCQGKIVFDGSITLTSGDILIKNPICVTVENGFVKDIDTKNNNDAKKLLDCILDAEKSSLQREAEGKIPIGRGEVYKKNARNIGELGIGLNPKAKITGNMLEDEKAFKTCHFAIGQNYDGDAPALIHLDGLVKNPTIVINYSDGTKKTILEKGILQ